MSRRPLFAPRSLGLILCLVLIALGIGILKLRATPSTTKPLPLILISPTPISDPTPTIIPPTPTLSATPSATPASAVNPLTGWSIYENSRYGFTFNYPPSWNKTEFHEQPQPIILVGIGTNQDIAALTVTEADWPTDTLLQTATGSSWSYAGWQGKSIQTKQNDLPLTIVTATQKNSLGLALRITWLRSVDRGNPYTIDAYLKPILKTFRFL